MKNSSRSNASIFNHIPPHQWSIASHIKIHRICSPAKAQQRHGFSGLAMALFSGNLKPNSFQRAAPMQKVTSLQTSYDVIIIGGGIMGASTACFLSQNKDFQGKVLVVERDPTYEFASTSHTNSCLRQQFSTGLNVRISQFAAD